MSDLDLDTSLDNSAKFYKRVCNIMISYALWDHLIQESHNDLLINSQNFMWKDSFGDENLGVMIVFKLIIDNCKSDSKIRVESLKRKKT